MAKIQTSYNFTKHKKRFEKPLLVNTTKFVEQNSNKTLLKAFKHQLRTTLEKSVKKGKLILTQDELNSSKQFFKHQFCGLPNSQNIRIAKTQQNNFNYTGLSSCSMVWRCPVCSLKILSGRNKQINHLLTHHIKKGYSIGFLTLTMRHKKSDSLEYTFNKLNGIYRKIRQHKEFRNLTKNNLFLGQIKSLEITYTNKNGWHPHIHVLYLYKTNDNVLITRFQKSIISKWAKLTNSQVKRQDQSIIKNLNEVGQYITKFDVSKELTGDFSKTSKGIKPFQMLAAMANNQIVLGTKTLKESNKLLTSLWVEYITTTKGKHRISISPEINYAYKLEEKTDDQLTKEIDIKHIVLSMSKNIMQTVINNEIKADLINICYDYPDNLTKQQNTIFELLQEFEYIQKHILPDGSIHILLNQLN